MNFSTLRKLFSMNPTITKLEKNHQTQMANTIKTTDVPNISLLMAIIIKYIPIIISKETYYLVH